jgi:hypothetical protein
MKVAILSESPADEAALRILVNGLLGRETQAISPLRLQSRGWPSVRRILPAVFKHLHYQTDAEGFVVVVDSNDSSVHQVAHDRPNSASQQCRLCQLRTTIAQVQGQLHQVPAKLPIKIAIGLAIPAIEAWYRCGVDPQATEAAWNQWSQSRRSPDVRNRLKREVYGTDRPLIALEERYAIEAARRLVHPERLCLLEELFPNGFGPLAREVRRW